MKRSYPNKRTLKAGEWLRIACVVFMLLFVLQAYFVMAGILPQDRYLGDSVFFALVIAAVPLSIYMVLVRDSMSPAAFGRLMALELVAIGFIITSTGFGSPLSLSLILLLYAAYRIYAYKGLLVSAALLIIGIAIDIYRAVYLGLPNISETIMVVLTLMATGVTVASILRTQVVRQNVLERSKAQAELERYRASTLMNNLTQGVLSVDSRGIVRMYNAAALGILDTNDSLNGRHIDEVFKVRDEHGKRLHLFPIMKKSKYTEVRDDLFYKYTDGVASLEVTITPIRVGRHHSRLDIDQGFILLLRDITKQKNLDEERDEFISVVSHELRTPLTIAEGTLSNIQAMYDKGVASSDRIQPALEAAHQQMVFLSKMVNDLSTLSRAERGVADEVEVIDVSELLGGLYAEHTPGAHAAGLALDIDVAKNIGTIKVSRLYVTELLQNFITNAIKYTKEGSVKLAATRSRNVITISVVDTGIGIGKADREKIFGKFYRSEDYRTRETRGTGLGLYVAMKLSYKLGTKIDIKSRLNHGSTFSIALKATDSEK